MALSAILMSSSSSIFRQSARVPHWLHMAHSATCRQRVQDDAQRRQDGEGAADAAACQELGDEVIHGHSTSMR
jgi:hypothetical protein